MLTLGAHPSPRRRDLEPRPSRSRTRSPDPEALPPLLCPACRPLLSLLSRWGASGECPPSSPVCCPQEPPHPPRLLSSASKDNVTSRSTLQVQGCAEARGQHDVTVPAPPQRASVAGLVTPTRVHSADVSRELAGRGLTAQGDPPEAHSSCGRGRPDPSRARLVPTAHPCPLGLLPTSSPRLPAKGALALACSSRHRPRLCTTPGPLDLLQVPPISRLFLPPENKRYLYPNKGKAQPWQLPSALFFPSRLSCAAARPVEAVVSPRSLLSLLRHAHSCLP